MKFTRLRLSGFKSFVEPTELYVEPGLTAVIGPNGCGKSNLFDAMLLELLVAFLQAYVFAILTCIYLNEALHLHDHH